MPGLVETECVTTPVVSLRCKTSSQRRCGPAVSARVLLVGDVRQFKAVEAGKPFAQLQAAGMATAPLHDIQRQQDAQLKVAVELAAEGQVRESLQHIAHRVVETSSVERRGGSEGAKRGQVLPFTPSGELP